MTHPTQSSGGRAERTFTLTLTLDEIKGTLQALDYFAGPSSKRYPHWTAKQKVDDAAARAELVPVTLIRAEDTWPCAVSDGLTLPCSDCGEVPHFDYRVTDEFWRRWVPEKPARLSVVCLPCLNRRCAGQGLAEALEDVCWTGTGHTVVLSPRRRYEYEERDDA